ncbi:MAG: DUF4276 family protein [Candidatus Latescibacteria bacterium]|jgi:hypothetical protein|nr:DUF4276 family protein [Candidatus Latescibacterota bacterium]
MPTKSCAEFPYTLLMVEGDTEILFYKRIKETYFRNARCSNPKNLHGNWSINTKVLDKTTAHLNAHPDTEFIICICIDRESRSGKAPIDMEPIKNELNCYPNIKTENIRLYEAVQDIESWFFHDIKGIYEFLRFPRNSRKIRKYMPVEKFNHLDLSRLFKQGKKEYRKGNASENFINHLNLEVIRKKSKVLNDFCTFMEETYNQT